MKKRLTTFLRLTLLAVLAAGSFLGVRAEEQRGEWLIVIPQSGDSYSVKMADVDRINLGTNQVTVVTNSGDKKSYGYNEVDRIKIAAQPVGISQITSEGNIAVWPTIVTSTLHIAGAAEGTPVMVYDMSGILVAEGKASSETLDLNLRNASAGVCIVKVGNKTVRIVKK